MTTKCDIGSVTMWVSSNILSACSMHVITSGIPIYSIMLTSQTSHSKLVLYKLHTSHIIYQIQILTKSNSVLHCPIPWASSGISLTSYGKIIPSD